MLFELLTPPPQQHVVPYPETDRVKLTQEGFKQGLRECIPEEKFLGEFLGAGNLQGLTREEVAERVAYVGEDGTGCFSNLQLPEVDLSEVQVVVVDGSNDSLWGPDGEEIGQQAVGGLDHSRLTEGIILLNNPYLSSREVLVSNSGITADWMESTLGLLDSVTEERGKPPQLVINFIPQNSVEPNRSLDPTSSELQVWLGIEYTQHLGLERPLSLQEILNDSSIFDRIVTAGEESDPALGFGTLAEELSRIKEFNDELKSRGVTAYWGLPNSHVIPAHALLSEEASGGFSTVGALDFDGRPSTHFLARLSEILVPGGLAFVGPNFEPPSEEVSDFVTFASNEFLREEERFLSGNRAEDTRLDEDEIKQVREILGGLQAANSNSAGPQELTRMLSDRVLSLSEARDLFNLPFVDSKFHGLAADKVFLQFTELAFGDSGQIGSYSAVAYLAALDRSGDSHLALLSVANSWATPAAVEISEALPQEDCFLERLLPFFSTAP